MRQGLDGLAGAVHQEAGLAVLDHFAAGSLVHRDHGHTGGIGLRQNQAESLRDGVEVEQCPGAREQRILAGHVHRADVADFLIQVRLDLFAKVRLILDDPSDEQRQSAPAGHFDRQVDALVGVNAAEEDQVVARAFLQRVQGEIDSVIDRRHVVESGRAVGIADGDEVPVAILFIDRHNLRRREAVDGSEHRRPHQAGVRKRHEIVVAVNEIELGGVLEGFRDVEVLGDFRIDGAVLFVPAFDHRMQPRAGHGVPGGKQGYVPTAGHQAFRNVAGHRLPRAVLPRRSAPGHRREHRHPVPGSHPDARESRTSRTL